MSTYADKWASKIRGLTIAQHAMMFRIAYYHRVETNLAFAGRRRISEELECSMIYLTQCGQHLENIGYFKREGRFQPDQTSNRWVLNFERWFPIPGHYSDEKDEDGKRRWIVDDATVKKEKQLLGYFRRAAENPHLAKGFIACWLEPLTKRKTKRPPVQRLWLAVASDSHKACALAALPDVCKEIESDLGLKFEIKFLETYLGKRD